MTVKECVVKTVMVRSKIQKRGRSRRRCCQGATIYSKQVSNLGGSPLSAAVRLPPSSLCLEFAFYFVLVVTTLFGVVWMGEIEVGVLGFDRVREVEGEFLTSCTCIACAKFESVTNPTVEAKLKIG